MTNFLYLCWFKATTEVWPWRHCPTSSPAASLFRFSSVPVKTHLWNSTDGSWGWAARRSWLLPRARPEACCWRRRGTDAERRGRVLRGGESACSSTALRFPPAPAPTPTFFASFLADILQSFSAMKSVLLLPVSGGVSVGSLPTAPEQTARARDRSWK